MSDTLKWIEIPLSLDLDECNSLEAHFARLGIRYRKQVVERSWRAAAGDFSGNLHHFFVTEEHGKAAAIFFQHYLDIENPDTAVPFSGTCPACGAAVGGAWTCPTCEISFRGEYDENHPMVQFIRFYSGFDNS